MIDVNRICNEYPKCDAIRALSATFEVFLKGNAPQPLVVTIYRDDDQYYPEMSHCYQAPAHADAHYPSFHLSKSIEEALENVFIHGLMHYDPSRSGGEWVENP